METLFYLHGKFSVEDKLVIIDNSTEDDYWRLSNEDLKVEFARGRLYIHSPASIEHELIFKFLFRLINYHLEEEELGEMLGSRVAVKLPNDHRPEPDLMYVEVGSYDPKKDKIYQGTPRWVIEIISPSTRKHDFGDKLSWYEDAKIEELWLIDPKNKQVTRMKYDENINAYKSRIINKTVKPLDFTFEINVEWIWDRPKISDIT